MPLFLLVLSKQNKVFLTQTDPFVHTMNTCTCFFVFWRNFSHDTRFLRENGWKKTSKSCRRRSFERLGKEKKLYIAGERTVGKTLQFFSCCGRTNGWKQNKYSEVPGKKKEKTSSVQISVCGTIYEVRVLNSFRQGKNNLKSPKSKV